MDNWQTIKQAVYRDIGRVIAWEQVNATGKCLQVYPRDGEIWVIGTADGNWEPFAGEPRATWPRQQVFKQICGWDVTEVVAAAQAAQSALLQAQATAQRAADGGAA